jgi:signal transduction histidine kinase
MEHGKVKEYFSVRIEKTEEKRLEEEKKLNESRYTELFNHISEGVVVMKKVNDQFIVTDFNEGAEKLDKRPKESVLGKPVAEIYPSAEVKKFDAYLQEAFETGHAHFPILSYQDEKINSWRKGYFYKLPNDEVVCVYNDITEEIIQLEQLKKYNEKLEEIAFKASHELRSPVASILGLMQLIDFSDLSDGNRMALEHMKSSVEKLDYIVRDAVKVTYDTEEGKKLFNKLSDLKQKIEYVS